jgi:signal transduction histidine kinase/ligand-binding sensor domain-containing protein
MRILPSRYLLPAMFLLLLAAEHVRALDPGKRLTQYQHKAWRVQDGFVPGGLEWVSQTEDGYLQLGASFSAAFQFDGVRFVPWSSPVGSSDGVRNFLPAQGGGFWIRDRRGVTHVMGKRVIAHFDFEGTYFEDHGNGMVEDEDGSLWVVLARYPGADGPLCKVTDLSAHCFGAEEGMPFQRADSILQDGKGGFWIGTDTALVHWKSRHSEVYQDKALRSNVEQDGIVGLVPDSDGSLWVGIAKSGPGLGLVKFVGGEFKPFVTRNFDGSKISVGVLLMDRDQTLWVGTNTAGVYRIHGEAVDHFGMAEGLSSDTVFGIYEDREGVIWVATSGGLDSFRDRNVTTFSHSEGLPSDLVVSVMASRDGTVWVANLGSLDFIRNGEVSSIRSGEGLPGNQVASLFEDRAGRKWVGVDDGLFLYENRQFRRLPEPNHRPLGMVDSIAEDTDGNIWATCDSKPRKLVRIRDFQVKEEFTSSPFTSGRVLAADAKGGIWVSTLAGDVVRFQNRTTHTFPLKLRTPARQIAAEPDGSILLAAPTEGLIGLHSGNFQRMTKKNGLPCDGVLGFVQDDTKNWWLETPCGYALVADSEMKRWWENPDTVVHYRLFDAFDGARTRLVTFNPATKSADGRLWFASFVLQTIDPGHILFNKLPPPVHIEKITADGKFYDLAQRLQLPPQVRDLTIDYTALSFVAPEKIRFRYKLEGQDPDWREVVNDREVQYSNLAPRRYTFRVMASNNNGVWNKEGASLEFSVLPAFYQTYWFIALCIAVFLAVVWGVHRLRVLELRREFNIGLEARVNERTRIARDLHDTLLQNFHGLMFQFQAARNLMLRRPDEAMRSLDDAIDETKKALAESRNAIQGLRSELVAKGNLAELLMSTSRELADSNANEASPIFDLVEEGERQTLSPNVSSEICRIALELLRNAYQHAHAHRIETEIRYGDSLFRLRIRDDGQGIDPRVLKEGGRVGHWGLRGISERADRIGARLDVWSEPDNGTEVELGVPAAIAYENLDDSDRVKLPRKERRRA